MSARLMKKIGVLDIFHALNQLAKFGLIVFYSVVLNGWRLHDLYHVDTFVWFTIDWINVI